MAFPDRVPVRLPETVRAAPVNLVPSKVIFAEPARAPALLYCT